MRCVTTVEKVETRLNTVERELQESNSHVLALDERLTGLCKVVAAIMPCEKTGEIMAEFNRLYPV